MSMSQVKRIKRNEDVPFVDAGVFAGSPACASTQRHYKPGTSQYNRWRTEPLPAPAATTVFIEYMSNTKVEVDYVTFVCPTHAAPIKSSITRDSRYSHDIEWAKGVDPADVARDVEGFIKGVATEKKRLHEQEQQEFEAAELARVRAGWNKVRADYNSAVGDPAFRKFVVRANPINEFGLSLVTTVRADMTPNEAREYAARLIEAADLAADMSALAKRP